MRHFLKSLFLFTALAGPQLAYATDFCNEVLDDWNGSVMGCGQSLQSLPQPVDEGAPIARRGGLPNSADLDLSPYDTYEFMELHFDLDVERLGLLPPRDNARYDNTRIDVLEFSLKSDSFVLGVPTDARVLAMSMVRPLGSTAYTLEFSWRDPAAADELNLTGELNAAVAQLNGTEKKIKVRISPRVNLADWSSLRVSTWAVQPGVDPATNVGLLPGANDRVVELVYDKPEGFAMTDSQMLSLVRPWKLRSGVLGGDIHRVGMNTNFIFYLPYIIQDQ